MSRSRPTSRPPLAWRATVGTVLGVLRVVFGWRVLAADPAVRPRPDRPLLVVFNHTSNIDAIVIADVVWRRLGHWCRPLVKSELFQVPLLGRLVRAGGAIRVLRSEGAGRLAAFAEAVGQLRRGQTVIIAPEGTITHDGSLLPLRHGAARIALEAGVDVLVATHLGAQRAFSPVARLPQRRATVTMALDLLRPQPDEDAAALTGRIAATMLDRSEQLRATYPDPDPDADWWPPYPSPGSPSATARENLERYRASMAETVAYARERMARIAEEHELDQRVSEARERVRHVTEEVVDRSRERKDELAEEAHRRVDELTARARETAATLGEHLPSRDTADEDDARPADGDEAG